MAQMQQQERKHIVDQITSLGASIAAERAAARADEQALTAAQAQRAQLHDEVAKELQRGLMPLIEHAQFLLSQLSVRSLFKLKFSDANPPPRELQRVLEAICICRGFEPNWRMVSQDPLKFIQLLQQQTIESVLSPTIIAALRPYTADPDFAPSRIAPYGIAVTVLSSWVRTIVDCYEVMSQHQPKCDFISKIDAEIASLASATEQRQKNLAVMLSQLNALENQLDFIQYSAIGFG